MRASAVVAIARDISTVRDFMGWGPRCVGVNTQRNGTEGLLRDVYLVVNLGLLLRGNSAGPGYLSATGKHVVKDIERVLWLPSPPWWRGRWEQPERQHHHADRYVGCSKTSEEVRRQFPW